MSGNTRASIRKLLNTIDTALSKQDEGAQWLWDILTALRGPDNYEQAGKDDTVLVRRKALPKTAEAGNMGYANGAQMRPWGEGLMYPVPGPNESHFLGHIDGALCALKFLYEVPDKKKAAK